MRTSCLRFLLGSCVLALSAAAAAQNAVTTDPVSVYAGPDDSYPMVAQLDADTPVQVMACLDDWSWCDVRFEDNRGWVYAPGITYNYEGGYVPFYAYAPSFGIPVVQFTIGEYWDRYYHGRPWYAQRDEWVHRGLPDHRRPPGPPPSAGPPPRSARADRPAHEGPPERHLRLGRAEPPHGDAERPDGATSNSSPRAPERRSGEHSSAAVPSHESHSSPADRGGPPPHEEHPQEHPQEHPPGHAETPRHEERAPSPQRAEGARQDARHNEKPSDHPADSPR